MAYRKVPFVAGEFYHVYSRGNSKQKIFLDKYDYERFTKLLYLANSNLSVDFREDIVRKGIDAFDFDRGKTLVSIGAWVLMPNHFHIYLTSNMLRMSDIRNGVTEFMRKLLTSYSKYFNKKYQRTGGLFEGQFKSVHVDGEQQAKYNFSYIHLNPVKLIESRWKIDGIKDWKRVEKFLNQYTWSSYVDYKDKNRPESKILNQKAFPKYFHNSKEFDGEIREWLNYNNEI